MRVRAGVLLAVIATSLAPGTTTVRGQEGHPLTGTWSGDWGPDAEDRRHLTVVMSWDGDEISAIVNPGPDAVTVPAVQLDVTSWTVRIEAQRPGTQGGAIAAEGRLEDLGSPHRTITGTWREGADTGTFRLIRD
jgi:hypothetical protein